MKTFFFKIKTQFLECCICFLSLLIFLLFETGCYSVGQAGLESLVFLSQHLWCWNLQVCTTTPSPFSFQSEQFCTFSFIVLFALFYVILVVQCMVSCVLNTHSTEQQLQSFLVILRQNLSYPNWQKTYSVCLELSFLLSS